MDGSPRGSTVPGILQARTLEWVAISFSNAWKWKVKVKSLSCVQLFATPWIAAYQAPLSMGFSRQEYWSGMPLPSPGSGGEISSLKKKKKSWTHRNTVYKFREGVLAPWWQVNLRKLKFPQLETYPDPLEVWTCSAGLSPNQTWVCSPAQKSQSTDTGLCWREVQGLLQGTR